MAPEILLVLMIFITFITLEVVYTSFFNKPNQTWSDAVVEIVSTGTLSVFTQPLVMASGIALGALLFEEHQGVLETWPAIAVFGLFLVFDDLSQYWWHRLSHNVAWLYKLHRPHHNAEYLSIRAVYRNNLFYYLLMPGLWLSGILIYLGGAWVYAFYIVLKMAVIFGAHSDVRWDRPLYKIKGLSPLMWLVERTISTPATHSAHHGKYSSDGITHYKGNYGNLLFFWDVLFGTAKITRQYPTEFGVENLPETTAAEQLLWPLVQSSQSISQTLAEQRS